jgi:hypothetical protein
MGVSIECVGVLRAFQLRYKTEKIRNVESSTLGKEGKYTQWLKNVMNFSAIPIVPHIRIICRQSLAKSLQHECSSFILLTAFFVTFNK